MATVGVRMGSLTRAQLEEFMLQAITELPRGSASARRLNGALAVSSPFPAWAVNSVLLDDDLCTALFVHLDVNDHATASVCHLWHREWRAMLARRRMLMGVAASWCCRGMPAYILKQADCLYVSEYHGDGKCDRLAMYELAEDELALKQELIFHDDDPWVYATAEGADGSLFCFDNFTLTLRKLRRDASKLVLQEAIVVRTLTDDEENESDDFIGHKYLELHERLLYLIRPPVVEAFDATTLADMPEHGFRLTLSIPIPRLPFEAFDPAQLLSYIIIDQELMAINRSGQLVGLARDCPFYPLNPFRFDVCDDRLYVLDAPIVDDDTDQEQLELLSLALDGRPTQTPLKLETPDDDIKGQFSLSASPDGVFVADFQNSKVWRVAFAGDSWARRSVSS
jgi:hypothetical protein